MRIAEKAKYIREIEKAQAFALQGHKLVDWGEVASFVMAMSGMANNAAWYVLMEAYDAVRRLPCYKQRTKQLVNAAIKEWNVYEKRLIADKFLDIRTMKEQARAMYADDITNEEFIDWWRGIGGEAYDKTKQFVSSLANKYRLALEKAGVQHAEDIGWMLTASAAFSIAVKIWEETIRNACREYGGSVERGYQLFRAFNLEDVKRAWNRAGKSVCDDIPIDECAARNIELGVNQLAEKWSDPKLMQRSMRKAIKAYKESFNKSTIKNFKS
jgi:hypothetical protein